MRLRVKPAMTVLWRWRVSHGMTERLCWQATPDVVVILNLIQNLKTSFVILNLIQNLKTRNEIAGQARNDGFVEMACQARNDQNPHPQ